MILKIILNKININTNYIYICNNNNNIKDGFN